MTNGEAIQTIKSECYISDLLNLDRTRMVNSALDKAVEALGADPCEDCISREAALNGFRSGRVCDEVAEDCIRDCQFCNDDGNCMIMKFLDGLPSVKPIAKNATTTEDCVSRQEVLNTLYREWHAWECADDSIQEAMDYIREKLPSVTLQPTCNKVATDCVRPKTLDDIAKPTEWPADSLTEEEVREAEKEGLALVRAYKDGYDAGYIAGVKAYRAFVELEEEENANND